MCKINRDPLADQLQFATFTSHVVVPCSADRKRMLEALVNGEFLRTEYRDSAAHALFLSMSTISALCRELEMDMAGNGALTSKKEVNRVAREFGMYVYTPVLHFQSIMRRLLFSSWTRGSRFSLHGLIMKFLNLFEDVDVESRGMAILASHMAFALYSARLYDGGRHSMPFFVDINSRGKVYLVYRYVSQKSGRYRVIRWNLGIRMPRISSAAWSEIQHSAGF